MTESKIVLPRVTVRIQVTLTESLPIDLPTHLKVPPRSRNPFAGEADTVAAKAATATTMHRAHHIWFPPAQTPGE